MNIFSMGSKKYSNSKFFDIIIEKQTYLNFIYSLISFPLSVLYFVFLITGIILSTSLLVIWIGVPLFIFVFDSIWFFASLEQKLSNKFLKSNIPQIKRSLNYDKSQMKIFLSYIKSEWTWRFIGYFILKFPLGIIAIIPQLAFVSLSFLMLYVPINSVFDKINILNMFQTESFIEAVFVFFIATIIWFAILNLINYVSSFLKRFSEFFLKK